MSRADWDFPEDVGDLAALDPRPCRADEFFLDTRVCARLGCVDAACCDLGWEPKS